MFSKKQESVPFGNEFLKKIGVFATFEGVPNRTREDKALRIKVEKIIAIYASVSGGGNE